MLELGVIEESHSDWASPIVLVPKMDGSVRFCVDYRRVNAVSKFDAYTMPRVDELGVAHFYSTLDLTKGYWQIPLSPLSKEKTAFTTPFGLHQFITLLFGLFGAPATFQHLMDKVLRPHNAYAAAYLDDIIIHSNDWKRHMEHLRAVLRLLRVAEFTANPRKCAIGRVEVRYLGFHLGHGQVRPQIDKTAAIAACPSPKTKKEVRQFLGLPGYYRRFIPNYSDLTSPLTDLTKKEAPDPVDGAVLFYPKRLTLHSSYTFSVSMCVPWELNPQPFALLTQFSTTEPQEHFPIVILDSETIAYFIKQSKTDQERKGLQLYQALFS